jgi:hypothetical protein
LCALDDDADGVVSGDRRFHYALDALAGAALAIAVGVAFRYLSGDGPGSRRPRGLAMGHRGIG